MNNSQNRDKGYLFLLGGYDLEMVTIRNILLEKGYTENIDFIDKKLSWGAKLSDYKEYLNEKKIIIGIELTKDIESPAEYITIDHHNENSDKPSSIEQIAELLNIELNFEQQLIAANDRGYIPEMIKMGASQEKISEIRKLDRQSQGVTEKQEFIAEKEISSIERIGNIAILFTSLDKFSPIVDRLSERRLIIYNSESLNYYGENVAILSLHYKDIIRKGKAYFGGGDNGFFGITKGYFSAIEIEKLASVDIPKILNLL